MFRTQRHIRLCLFSFTSPTRITGTPGIHSGLNRRNSIARSSRGWLCHGSGGGPFAWKSRCYSPLSTLASVRCNLQEEVWVLNRRSFVELEIIENLKSSNIA
ncbi:uncharacterized protein BDV14DRAFT_61268 [Aspergillus stella-maris]|uniref:uncharacterized protein n=1 Tax=Aspergillus stella-maris TaxID=1810926 RepID=UPI003CCD2607